jgi:hypothetical protein
MYKVGNYVVVPGTKCIKIIDEIEKIGEHYVFYFTDGTSEGMSNCLTVHEAYELEQ